MTKCLKCEHSQKECLKPKEEKTCANCGGNHVALYKGCPEFKKARLDLSKNNQTEPSYTNASAAKASNLKITTKMEKDEKINLIIYTADLIKACFTKLNFPIKTSGITTYSATLALTRLNLNIKGKEIFKLIYNPTLSKGIIESVREEIPEKPET